MDDIKEEESSPGPLTGDLENILLKPLTDRVSRDAFCGNKKLALLHSWDEIVYRDIGRVFEYKQFKEQWRRNLSHQSRLMENISIYKQHARNPSNFTISMPSSSRMSRHHPFPPHHQMSSFYTNTHSGYGWYGMNGVNGGNGVSHGHSMTPHYPQSVPPPVQKRKEYKHTVTLDGGHGLNIGSTPNTLNRSKLNEWTSNGNEVAERLPLSEKSQHSAGNMSFLSATNEISSSVSVSSGDRL